jgi:hypothetical protein
MTKQDLDANQIERAYDEPDYDLLEDDSFWADRRHREAQGCSEYDYPDHAFNDAGEYIP